MKLLAFLIFLFCIWPSNQSEKSKTDRHLFPSSELRWYCGTPSTKWLWPVNPSPQKYATGIINSREIRLIFCTKRQQFETKQNALISKTENCISFFVQFDKLFCLSYDGRNGFNSKHSFRIYTHSSWLRYAFPLPPTKFKWNICNTTEKIHFHAQNTFGDEKLLLKESSWHLYRNYSVWVTKR